LCRAVLTVTRLPGEIEGMITLIAHISWISRVCQNIRMRHSQYTSIRGVRRVYGRVGERCALNGGQPGKCLYGGVIDAQVVRSAGFAW